MKKKKTKNCFEDIDIKNELTKIKNLNSKSFEMNKYMLISFCIILILLSFERNNVEGKSIIMANYHNVLLFFPKEYGGNDDIRVIFDVRNVTLGTFRYMPVVVDVAYDSQLNNAYCYLESAVTSYILLLKWAGGKWCYQILFDFPSSQFSKYMYHSIILVENFIYWTTDRYVMSGRLPGYEKRLLLQPSWNRLYSMTEDKVNRLIYIAAFDFTENALFKCDIRIFSCIKMLTTNFVLNYVYFNSNSQTLYVSSVQEKNLYRYNNITNSLSQVSTVSSDIANIIVLDDDYAIYTNQQTITIQSSLNRLNATRKANAKLIDPYALQYIFTFNQVVSFDTYPYPFHFTDYHDLLYRNSLYLFYFYICGMDYVENDNVFLPQMDLNNQFLRIDNCETRFLIEKEAYIIPSLIAACATLLVATIIVVICLCRSKVCRTKIEDIRSSVLNERNEYLDKKHHKERKGKSHHQKNKKGHIKKEDSLFGKIIIKNYDNNLKMMSTAPYNGKTLTDSSCVSSINDNNNKTFSSHSSSSTLSSNKNLKSDIYSINGDYNQSKKKFDDNKGSYIYLSPPSESPISHIKQSINKQDNESYDNDPINLCDLDYSKYYTGKTKLNSTCVSSNPSKKQPKTYSSGFYILRKNDQKTHNNIEDNINRLVYPVPNKHISSSSTPTISQNSTDSSSNTDVTLGNTTSSSYKSNNNNNNNNNNKVKFNEFHIQHHYDQYEDFPIHSKIYNYRQIIESTTADLNDSVSSFSMTSSNENQQQSANPSSRKLSKDIISNSLTKKLTKYYKEKEFISTLQVPIYKHNNNLKNYVCVLKSFDKDNFNESHINL